MEHRKKYLEDYLEEILENLHPIGFKNLLNDFRREDADYDEVEMPMGVLMEYADLSRIPLEDLDDDVFAEQIRRRAIYHIRNLVKDNLGLKSRYLSFLEDYFIGDSYMEGVPSGVESLLNELSGEEPQNFKEIMREYDKETLNLGVYGLSN